MTHAAHLTETRLSRLLTARDGPLSAPLQITTLPGRSTFLVRTRERPFVVKWRPAPHPLVTIRAASHLMSAREVAHPAVRVPPTPADDHGWWLAVDWLDGTPLADAAAESWDAAQAASVGAGLAHWLKSLHTVRAGRGGWADRAEGVLNVRLERCREAGLVGPALARRVTRRWEDLRPHLSGVRRTLVHRDLQSANIILDGHAVSGVIDFEQARVADPLYDLVKLTDWVFTRHQGIAPAFLAAYGVDVHAPAVEARLSCVFLLEYLAALRYFHRNGPPSLVTDHHAKLDRLLSDGIPLR
ncbi:aminoglycoside phosphotransferase family protein [Streptomyces sp. NPDC014685]|uniref:aminoglycoside phosphotransferase family protein n=1 Tax=Streptomyces sp. NPDC014685 TaxID=3364881 RepID=UPI0036F7E71C